MPIFKSILKLRRGVKANLPTLREGEPAYCTDTNDLYVGYNGNNRVTFNTPIDLTSASNDYTLKVGETAVITFTNTTSVPLHVATVEGIYDTYLSFINLATPTNNGIVLSPNNTTYSNAMVQLAIDGYATTIGQSSQTRSDIALGYAGGILYKHTISTHTAGKAVIGIGMFKTNGGVYQHTHWTQYWNDVVTAWSSLGTITLPSAQSGKFIITRIV